MIGNFKIIFLADNPTLIPILAQWTYQEWHSYDPSLTLKRALESFSNRLNYDKIPLALIAMHNENPIGMVTLKRNAPLQAYQDRFPWVGNLYVISNYRKKGIGKKLMQEVQALALKFGYNELFLFTSDPLMPNWYTQLGWQNLAKEVYQNHLITLMNLKM